jgi:hypothetical protein
VFLGLSDHFANFFLNFLLGRPSVAAPQEHVFSRGGVATEGHPYNDFKTSASELSRSRS